MNWPTPQSEFISRPLPLSIASERDAFVSNAASGDRMIVTLHSTHPRMRGSLADALCDALEQTLREQGAPAVDLQIHRNLEDFLDDALYRVGLLGCSGIAIEIESLSAIADDNDTLHPDDGRALVLLVLATKHKPLQLLLPPAVRALKIFPEAIPVFQILPHGSQQRSAAVIEYGASEGEPESAGPLLDWLSDESTPSSLLPPSIEAFADDPGEQMQMEAQTLPADAPVPSFSRADDIDEAWSSDDDIVTSLPPVVSSKPENNAVSEPEPPAQEAPAQAMAAEEGPALKVAAPAPLVIADETFQHLRELDATFGPKPLATIERLYASAFVPLQRTVGQGRAPANAAAVLDEWSKGFAKSYKEAFEALKQRGRRPSMIMDLPEIAQRIARLHGARTVQLLMVDGMRLDLAQRINERLTTLLATKAACAEQHLLWAGLPATTATQLELLGRGPNALREFTGAVDDEVVVNRGRLASSIRRIRTGHRELLKLDLIEAKLMGMGAASEERLEEIATAVAPVLAAHIEQQPPGTLVMIFGDHGFVLETDEQGNTTQVAAPSGRVEEVITGAFAWLAGSLH